MLLKFKSKKTQLLVKYTVILFFSFVSACSISLILSPNQLAPGGVTGLSIIVNHYTGLSTGALYFLINVPIMVIGIWKFGAGFFVSNIVAIIAHSIFVDLLAPIGPITTDPVLAALFGGAISAISLGMIFKVGSSSGGTDVVVRLLKLKFPHIETGRLFLVLNVFVVALSAIAFKNITVAMYAGIAVFVSSHVMDLVLYGRDGAKLLFIISSHEQEIALRLLEEIGTGVTYVNGVGAYTSQDKKIIMCVLKKQNLPKAQNIVRNVDSSVFMIVSSASEVLGEGYKSPYQENL
ncbi:MAG: YitT family protein [Clostridiales bacterium]|nr:YitT family protein [Clostridiales bacterium]